MLTEAGAPASTQTAVRSPAGSGGRTGSGLLVRFRAQSLGVLALAISAGVVIAVVFVMPHVPAAVGSHSSLASGRQRATPRNGSALDAGAASRVHGGRPPSSGRPTSLGASTSVPSPAPAIGPAQGGGDSAGALVAPPTGSALSGDSPRESAVTAPPSGSQATTATTAVSSAGPGSGSAAPAGGTEATGESGSATPPAGTTAPPTTLPPHVATAAWPGNLQSPYVSTQYQVTTTGGVVSATATWSGTPDLVLTVACGGATKQVTGASGVYASEEAPAGSCSVTLGEPPGVSVPVSYSLSANYPVS